MSEQKGDAYIAYIHRFFKLWVPVYDLFGAFIKPVYRRTITALNPAPGSKILDVCTGTGEIAIRLAKVGADVAAIDITPVMLDRARKKGASLPIKFIEADARKLPFADKSFDQSVISLGLHDMPRPVRLEVLAEMRRVTKSRLVVTEYYFEESSLYHRLMRRFIALFETSYFKRFSAEGAVPLLNEAGLSKVEIEKMPLLCFAVYTVQLG